MTAPNSGTSAAMQLVELGESTYQFGCTPDGMSFAMKHGHHVVLPLRGGRLSLRAELAAKYRDQAGKIAPQQALADAMLALEGKAQGAKPREVHLRVAEANGAVWIDRGDVEGHVIKLTGDGWEEVTTDVPVRFRRTELSGELPPPQRGGNLDDLFWPMVNVSKQDQPLLKAAMVSALAVPGSPIPVVALTGEQGTGKSVTSKAVVSLIDPSSVPLRQPPRNTEAWVIAASGSWVVGLDNLSTIPDWLSDTLCRAVTGDGDVRRQLYTDAGLTVFAFRRVIVLNGIDLGGLRGDLADRLITIELERISERQRRSEHDLLARWDETYPVLFGALLDQAASMLRVLPSVHLKTSPRMADFARVVAALDQINGTSGLVRYLDQGKRLASETLSAEPFIVTMMATITEFDDTAAALLDEMTDALGKDARPGRDWPKNARAVTGLLKRYAPALRQAKWTVDASGTNNKDHVTTWKLVKPEEARNGDSSSSPEASLASMASMASNENGQSQDDPSDALFDGYGA